MDFEHVVDFENVEVDGAGLNVPNGIRLVRGYTTLLANEVVPR